jgi:hypothetical protein
MSKTICDKCGAPALEPGAKCQYCGALMEVDTIQITIASPPAEDLQDEAPHDTKKPGKPESNFQAGSVLSFFLGLFLIYFSILFPIWIITRPFILLCLTIPVANWVTRKTKKRFAGIVYLMDGFLIVGPCIFLLVDFIFSSQKGEYFVDFAIIFGVNLLIGVFLIRGGINYLRNLEKRHAQGKNTI